MRSFYKVIIIDDDELAADNLTFALKPYTKFKLEGWAKNGFSAKKLILKTKPDLIFLDIELPDILGYELLEQLQEDTVNWQFQVVFYTAYQKYMLNAIRNSIFDFLLKPLDKDELNKVLQRFIDKEENQQLTSVPYHIQLRSLSSSDNTIIIPSNTNDLHFLRPENIGYFHYNSEEKAWIVYLNNNVHVSLKKNISGEQILKSSTSFVQVHQSYIININYLVMIKDKKCILYPPFENVLEIQISRTYMKKLQERFLML